MIPNLVILTTILGFISWFYWCFLVVLLDMFAAILSARSLCSSCLLHGCCVTSVVFMRTVAAIAAVRAYIIILWVAIFVDTASPHSVRWWLMM